MGFRSGGHAGQGAPAHGIALLEVDIVAVVSNHAALADMAVSYGVAFHHFALPPGAGAEAKQAQEARVATLIEQQRMVYSAITELMRGDDAPIHAVDKLTTRSA